ncbi:MULTISPECIES: hypothetical protein [Anaeromyxobacter]|uniref:hypothetical protein n=1 Tax=Anaeromyxobacter TaxID=161492 RepID=UPI001F571F84|nr:MULTISPECIES: hypothetical protein [unclassified Anaeromyxobacter]
MRNITPVIALGLAILAGPAVRADTVEVTSTTLLTVGEQTRGGVPGEKPELVTVAPAYEILNIAARGVTNPIAKDLQLVVSTWGSYELADRRWDNGTGSDLTGDVMTGYLSGRLLGDALTLRLGRTHVMTGVARMIQLDGGEAIVTLPFGLRLSGYAGAPVSQRFGTRSGVRSWNPVAGDLAYGGRAAVFVPIPGYAGRGLDVGASANFVEDGGDPVRQEVGADFRLQPLAKNLTLSGFGSYSLYDERFSEGNAAVSWSVKPRLHLTADWRFTAPDLFLARNSILSVFSTERRNDIGGGVRYELQHGLEVGADYHLAIEPGEDGDYYGHLVQGSLDWERGETAAGAEVFYLDALENGYVGGRLFGRQDFGKFFAAADVLGHFFREQVNGEDYSISGTLTAGVELAKGFSAVVAGRAGMTPFLEQTYDVMAKLVYNQTYRIREVR